MRVKTEETRAQIITGRMWSVPRIGLAGRRNPWDS